MTENIVQDALGVAFNGQPGLEPPFSADVLLLRSDIIDFLRHIRDNGLDDKQFREAVGDAGLPAVKRALYHFIERLEHPTDDT